MIKVFANSMFWFLFLSYVNCRPQIIDLLSHYEHAFETSNCSNGKLILSSLSLDDNSQENVFMPLKLCSNISDSDSVTYKLCDEIFSTLFNVYCHLISKVNLTVSETWNTEISDLYTDFNKYITAESDSNSQHISSLFSVKEVCEVICKDNHKTLCTLLLVLHKMQNVYTAQLQETQKSNSNIKDIKHSDVSISNTPSSTTEFQLKEEITVSIGTNSPKKAVSNFVASKTKSLPANVTKIHPHPLSIEIENAANELNTKTDNDSSSKMLTHDRSTNLNKQADKVEITDDSLNNTYLNNNEQSNTDVGNVSSSYEKGENDSTLISTETVINVQTSKISQSKNQIATTKLMETNSNSDKQLNSNEENNKFDNSFSTDQLLKDAGLIEVSSNVTTTTQAIKLEQDEDEDTQGTLSDEDESANKVSYQKLLTEETEAIPALNAKPSENFEPETSLDDESTFPNELDLLKQGIETKKSDITMFSQLSLDTLSNPNEDVFRGQEDNNFIFYFIVTTLGVITFYVLFHNKQKIIALIVEGCQERRRRPHGVSYRKLDTMS